MSDKEFQISITTTADASGAEQAKEPLETVPNAGADASRETLEIDQERVEAAQELAQTEAEANTAAEEALEIEKERTEAVKERTAAAKEAPEAEFPDNRTQHIIDNNQKRLGPLMEDGAFFPQRVVERTQEAAAAARSYAQEQNRAAAAIMAQSAPAEEGRSIAAQRQIIAFQMVEALETQAAGDVEGAAFLLREEEIRRTALALQQQANLTEKESLELATKKIMAEEASATATAKGANAATGLAGALTRLEPNWKGLVAHSTTIARELVSGTGSLQSWTSLLGNITPAYAGIGLMIAGAVNAPQKLLELEEQASVTRWKSGKDAADQAGKYRRLRDGQAEEAEGRGYDAAWELALTTKNGRALYEAWKRETTVKKNAVAR